MERRERDQKEGLLWKEMRLVHSRMRKVVPGRSAPLPKVESLSLGPQGKELIEGTVDILSSVDVADRERTLKNICEAALQKPLAHTALEESIIVSHSDPNQLNAIKALEEVKASPEYFETTPLADFVDVTKNIEKITGYDVLTKTSTPMVQLKVETQLLSENNILLQHSNEVISSLRKDLAIHYRVREEDINIRLVTHGSVEVLFSLPANTIQDHSPNKLPFFKQLLQKTLKGNIEDIKIATKQVLPDVTKAKELLKQHVTPLVIKLNDKANKSDIMAKFGSYLPTLASLSSHVKVVHNKTTDSLEIHGPDEEKGNILFYFSQIEEALQGVQTKQVNITLDVPKTKNYPELWKVLYKAAVEFTQQNYSGKYKLNYEKLRINPELEKGCPVASSFINALQKLSLDPNKPKDVLDAGTFGWHGTRTPENISSIAHNNLDPGRRSGQCYGPGEYCAVSAGYSQGSYWGNTNTLFLFFMITKCSHYKMNSHHVVNNPNKNEMYMVPILIATFQDAVPVPIHCNEQPVVSNYDPEKIKWEWKDDYSWVSYGAGQNSDTNVQMAIEECYDSYKSRTGGKDIVLTFIRLRDNRTDPYLIDFSLKQQINQRTNYRREIRRLEENIEKW